MWIEAVGTHLREGGERVQLTWRIQYDLPGSIRAEDAGYKGT